MGLDIQVGRLLRKIELGGDKTYVYEAELIVNILTDPEKRADWYKRGFYQSAEQWVQDKLGKRMLADNDIKIWFENNLNN